LIHFIRHALALLLVLTLASCATTPRLTQEEVLGEYEPIATLERALRDAAARDLDILAPEGFEAARTHFDEALSAATANRREAALTAAAAGLETIEKANDDADISRDLLREVLIVRERANRAGASSIYSESSADLDTDLRRTASLVERGKLEEVKRRRPRLLAGYEQLELAALKEGMVDAAKAALQQARDSGAAKTAPKTYRLAEEELALALSVLDADRTMTEKANTHAMRAKWLAERSMGITELIKDFDRRDYSREDVVLWYQKQLSEINEPIATELPFNEPNRDVVLSLQQSIKDLRKQRDDTALARSQYEQELSVTAEQRAAMEKVVSLFSSTEANVYQQRQNVLISAHGFRFPSGGSELESQNFALLNKIIQAINTFPESTVRISGHTDAVGSAILNQALSEQRATNVAKFLVEVGGVDPRRIAATGYGKERPVASNETAEGRAANRRVEILIVND